MRRLRFSRIVVLVIIGSIMWCVNNVTNASECLTSGQRLDLYRNLRMAWPKYTSNSASCHGAQGLAQLDEDCRRSFACLSKYGYELEWVYKLTDWFLLETRTLGNGRVKYFRLRMNPLTADIEFRSFDLNETVRIDVSRYADPLRFAPLVVDPIVGYTEMWDSKFDNMVSVPRGFHAIIQGGDGFFLLRKDDDGEYYRWDAVKRAKPVLWKYRFPAGYNPRSNFFIALSSETGKSYAFAVRFEPIPNSEGALAISPCGAFKGRHYYEVWKGCGVGRLYYAWPESDDSEPLSNCTETFGGGKVVVRDGILVVLSSIGRVAVDEFDSYRISCELKND